MFARSISNSIYNTQSIEAETEDGEIRTVVESDEPQLQEDDELVNQMIDSGLSFLVGKIVNIVNLDSDSD